MEMEGQVTQWFPVARHVKHPAADFVANLRNFGAVIVLSAANFPRYEVFESISQNLPVCFREVVFATRKGQTVCSDVHYSSLPVFFSTADQI